MKEGYAAMILHGDGQDITAAKITTLLDAANVDCANSRSGRTRSELHGTIQWDPVAQAA